MGVSQCVSDSGRHIGCIEGSISLRIGEIMGQIRNGIRYPNDLRF